MKTVHSCGCFLYTWSTFSLGLPVPRGQMGSPPHRRWEEALHKYFLDLIIAAIIEHSLWQFADLSQLVCMCIVSFNTLQNLIGRQTVVLETGTLAFPRSHSSAGTQPGKTFLKIRGQHMCSDPPMYTMDSKLLQAAAAQAHM